MNNLLRKRCIAGCASLSLFAAMSAFAQAQVPAYDLVLQNGHVLDDKNHIDSVMDVAIKDGKIAKVAEHIPATSAIKAIDVKGLYVAPGLIDLHVHVYNGTGEKNSYAGDNSVPPDGFTFRVGVTTVVDAGCSGWKTSKTSSNASSTAPRRACLQCSISSAQACAAISTSRTWMTWTAN